MYSHPMLRSSSGLEKVAGPGDLQMSGIIPYTNDSDSDQVIPLAAIMGGLYSRPGLSNNREDTLPTAAAILAAQPNMNVGDNFICHVVQFNASHLSFVGGAGITVNGNAYIGERGMLLFTKTSETTMTCTLL